MQEFLDVLSGIVAWIFIFIGVETLYCYYHITTIILIAFLLIRMYKQYLIERDKNV